MCDFANMGGGYGQRFQQFEQNHPQFQKAWGAMTQPFQPFGNMLGQHPQPAPVQQPGTSVPTMPRQGGAMDA